MYRALSSLRSNYYVVSDMQSVNIDLTSLLHRKKCGLGSRLRYDIIMHVWNCEVQ